MMANHWKFRFGTICLFHMAATLKRTIQILIVYFRFDIEHKYIYIDISFVYTEKNTPIFRSFFILKIKILFLDSQDYAAWYAHCPGLKVISPYTAEDYKGSKNWTI